MKRITLAILLSLFGVALACAQGSPPIQNVPANGVPECQIGPVTTTVTGRSTVYDNRFTGCTSWTIYEYGNGSISAVSVELDEAPDNNATPGSWVLWPVASTSKSVLTVFPITSTSAGQASLFNFFPWVSVNVTSLTGAGANVTYLAVGFRPRFGNDATAIPSGASGSGGGFVSSSGAAIAPATAESNSISNVSTFPANNQSAAILGTETFGVDPCQSSGVPKLHAFANITTATTTALVAVSGSTVVYVCGIDFELSSSTASTVLFEQGTGAACATAPAALSATYTNASVPLQFHMGFAGHTYMKTAASNGFCAVSTVGTGPTIPVDVTYVQQ